MLIHGRSSGKLEADPHRFDDGLGKGGNDGVGVPGKAALFGAGLPDRRTWPFDVQAVGARLAHAVEVPVDPRRHVFIGGNQFARTAGLFGQCAHTILGHGRTDTNGEDPDSLRAGLPGDVAGFPDLAVGEQQDVHGAVVRIGQRQFERLAQFGAAQVAQAADKRARQFDVLAIGRLKLVIEIP